jgi:two-component system, OmpR family, phosphate regulon sensor histidine kinase PhoR
MYKKKLFLYFFLVFAVFTILVTVVQHSRETNFKKENLNSDLDIYAWIVKNFITQNNLSERDDYSQLDSLYGLIDRKNLRITVVDLKGDVLYDSDVAEHRRMQNHIHRPEIQGALRGEYGTDIRLSASTGTPYYYYARMHGNYFVRAAIDYDMDIITFLRAERMFFLVIILLFLIITLLLVYLSGRFGKTVSALKDFAMKAARDEKINPDTRFPESELGEISQQIVNIYNNLQKTRDDIKMEKNKLIRHLYISREGIAIFSPDKGNILSNSLFIQNINFISDQPAVKPENVFSIPEFREACEFIESNLEKDDMLLQTGLPARSFAINKRGKYFSVQVIIFPDKTFEISVNDITAKEQEKNIKQQLTSNIAHELRTPVSSIQGYLETISNAKDLDKNKQAYFIDKAYRQAIRLSELISDISVLNRIEEGSISMDNENIRIHDIIKEVTESLEPAFQRKNITTSIKLCNDITVKGNYSLVYSIFQNLFENSVIHAGENITITVDCYFADENYYYFSYHDTGVGIPEKHIGRVFERFYRVDQGRMRKSGGTGLGLAIIKNAVLYHQGDISVKNREGGGVEFFFSLRKNPYTHQGNINAQRTQN